MAETRAQAYAAQLDRLTAIAEALAPETRRRIVALLDELNREILADLARTSPGSYTAARLRMLKAEVDRNLAQFAQQTTSSVNRMQSDAWRQTSVQVESIAQAATGGVMIHPVIDRSLLQVVQGYTADLISGLSQDMAARINAAIQRAAMGGLNLQGLIGQIGTVLEGGKFSGIFSSTGERAIAIATNEIGRVQSLATMAQIHDLSTRHKDIRKRWREIYVAHVPRVAHILADKQVRNPKEPFNVGGEELQYPRDPRGSPGNTINCHCLVQPYFPDEVLKPTERERSQLYPFENALT